MLIFNILDLSHNFEKQRYIIKWKNIQNLFYFVILDID